jgi:hypothetical protein
MCYTRPCRISKASINRLICCFTAYFSLSLRRLSKPPCMCSPPSVFSFLSRLPEATRYLAIASISKPQFPNHILSAMWRAGTRPPITPVQAKAAPFFTTSQTVSSMQMVRISLTMTIQFANQRIVSRLPLYIHVRMILAGHVCSQGTDQEWAVHNTTILTDGGSAPSL